MIDTAKESVKDLLDEVTTHEQQGDFIQRRDGAHRAGGAT